MDATRLIINVIVVLQSVGAVFAAESSKNSDKEPPVATVAIPESVDLRPQFNRWGLRPKRQGTRNTCSVFTTSGALEFAASKHYQTGTPLSVEYLNWACNQEIRNNKHDRGQFFHDLLKGFERHGICRDANMPYAKRFDPELRPTEAALKEAQEIESLGLKIHWINPWRPKPGLTDEQLVEIKRVLARGYPVAAGASHSRLLVGYRNDPQQPGGGIFLTKDSGTGSFSKVTYEFVRTNVGDVFWVEAPTP